MQDFRENLNDENRTADLACAAAAGTQNFPGGHREPLEIYRTVSKILSHSRNFEKSINEVLDFVGKTLKVSRVYVFETDSEDPGFCSCSFEWCAEGISPLIGELQHLSYDEHGYAEFFSENQRFICKEGDCSGSCMRSAMERRNIAATANYAFFDNEQLAGFIGVDDCFCARADWNPKNEEIEALVFIADLLSTYLIKERNLERARKSEEKAYKEAERSKEFLEMIETFAGSAPWYVYYNEDGTEKEAKWGQNLRDMLGYTGTEDFPDMFESWLRSVRPDKRESILNDLIGQADTNNVFSIVYPAVRKDGSSVLMKTEGIVRRYENGMPRLYYGTIRDVTEEEALRQKELESKTYLEHFVRSYTSAYTVNLKDKCFEILHMAHDFREVFTMNGNLEDMAAFVETHIHPDDRKLMRMMSNPDYIRERLKTDEKIIFTEREQYGGVERVMHVSIMRGADADHCVIGFLDVTAELQKEKEVNEKLEEANEALLREHENLKIIETLSTSFSSIYAVDMSDFSYKRVVEREPSALIFPKTGLFAESFSKYVESFMQPAYRDEFLIMLDKENVRKALSDDQKVVLEYCREDNTWRRGYFLPSEYDEDGTLKSFLFAVQNIDEDKQN